MKDDKLWKAFSEFIRLRDSDDNGNCKCITCGNIRNWRSMDCGHGIGRQHKATKYDERNNHAQCKPCNAFEGGRREVYKEEVDKRYGAGTWNTLEVLSRGICKRGPFEIESLTKHYQAEAARLKKEKGL